MQKSTPQVVQVFDILSKAKKYGITQNTINDQQLTGRHITLHQKEVLNFASCSYLGLEKDSRLIEATIEATRNFGTHFSASRAYVSLSLYQELEHLLSQLFGNPTIVSASTTLGHMSVIPTLIGKEDAIILDHQVHASVQNAAKLAIANGTYVEMIRHNRVDYLEARIKKLQTKYRKIWYMADGVYSMYGDFAPINELHELLDKYEAFNLYVDDAHGMSWMGKKGIGYALNGEPLHQRMIVLTSLNKAFSAAGGAIICPNKETEEMLRLCGASLMFSGPVQPPMLGAAIASAKIHLSGEIEGFQKGLERNMTLFRELIQQNDLPLLGEGRTPIFYIGIGKKEHGFRMIQRLMERGFYTSIGIYPGVPLHRTGVRVTINENHTETQIRGLMEVIMEELQSLFKDENIGMNDLLKTLKLPKKELV
ncbi:MAG: 7-keto-8-aminopelargonate synthetase-like enzyme [Saprospiraceae bacterium]|jgi:7-keto-8-aminopelargonate synthetase-like enzyme